MSKFFTKEGKTLKGISYIKTHRYDSVGSLVDFTQKKSKTDLKFEKILGQIFEYTDKFLDVVSSANKKLHKIKVKNLAPKFAASILPASAALVLAVFVVPTSLAQTKHEKDQNIFTSKPLEIE